MSNLSREEIERTIKELEDEMQICKEEIYEKERELADIKSDLFKLQCQLKPLTNEEEEKQ